MKKLFISQPMKGKSDSYIRAERQHLIEVAEEVCKEKFEVIDSYFPDFPKDIASEKVAVGYLGNSIQLMSKADVVIFSRDWEDFRGCRIEHEVAIQYGFTPDIELIESYSDFEVTEND